MYVFLGGEGLEHKHLKKMLTSAESVSPQTTQQARSKLHAILISMVITVYLISLQIDFYSTCSVINEPGSEIRVEIAVDTVFVENAGFVICVQVLRP